MRCRCLKVGTSEAERVRRELLKKDLLDLNIRVRSQGRYILFPLNDQEDENVSGMGEVVITEMEQVKRHPRSYKDLLKMPSELHEKLPSSHDIIGDVCILKLPIELEPYIGDIGKALLEVKKNIRVVALDKGVKGDFRIRDIEVIAGDPDLETTHVENNLRFKLDPSRVYFSPRLATERARVAKMITGGRVLDMFAGVGPFSLNCSRHGKPDEVIGIDLNPDCIDYFRNNIRLNSASDIVEAYLGDACEAPIGMGPFDVVIMNLPHGSIDFLSTALQIMDEGRIHLYSIVDMMEVKSVITEITGSSDGFEKKLEIFGMREVHNYSATQSMMAFDIIVKRDP